MQQPKGSDKNMARYVVHFLVGDDRRVAVIPQRGFDPNPIPSIRASGIFLNNEHDLEIVREAEGGQLWIPPGRILYVKTLGD